MTQPLIFAHRGLAEFAPENTYPAHIAALTLGFGLEVDIRLAADGEIVIFHDYTLERLTGQDGQIEQLPLTAIRALDAGHKFDPLFAGEGIVTLSTLFDWVKQFSRLPISLLLDIKRDAALVTENVCAALAAADMVSQCILIGQVLQNVELRQQYQAREAEINQACLVPANEDWDTALNDRTANWLYTRWMPTSEQVAAAHEAGKQVLMSGPLVMRHEPGNWRHLLSVGVDALITDYPLDFARLFDRPWKPA